MRPRGRLGGTRTLPLAAVLLALAASAAAEPVLPPALRDVGFDQRLGEQIPLDVSFRDEAGRQVKLGDYFGKRPVVLSLVYYECPMLCTLTLNGLVSAMSVLSFDPGKEFEAVTVSFDPREGAELASLKKKAYLNRYRRAGAEASWHFLTGDRDSIAALTRAVGFRYAWDETSKQFAHPSGVVVLTAAGRIARYLYGVEYAPKDLRLALLEAGEGKIGIPVLDPLLLYCYQYDAMTGRYSAAILRLVRVSAVLTLLALGAFITISLRRERPAGKERG